VLDGFRILLAEDNATNQMVAVQMLESLGAEVQVAADGVEALEILDDNRFDILVVDIEMPRMNGIELMRRLRGGSGPHAAVPMIALTAYVMREHRQAIAAVGADGVIAKPITSIDDFGRQLLEFATPRLGLDPPAEARRSQARASAEGAALDPSALDALAEVIGAEALAEIVTKADADIREHAGRLCGGAQSGDMVEVRAAAHVLSGLAGTIGARRMGALVREIQEAARADEGEKVASLAVGLPREVESALSELASARSS
jgi:CheY-like chemotaxis protein